LTPFKMLKCCHFMLLANILYSDRFSKRKQIFRRYFVPITYFCTRVLISPQPYQKGNKLQWQKILIFIYPIYNHNWRNISTIYIIRLASNEIFSPSNKLHREVGRAKDLSAPGNYLHTPGTSFFSTVTILDKSQKLQSSRLPNQPDATVFQNTLLVIWLPVVQ
jgi:hypothetical protein